jgi:gliding motility-associated-like protein
VVNDKGNNIATVPNKQYDETLYTNNTSLPVSITPFAISLQPNDTMLLRQDEILLVPIFSGGLLSGATWSPKTFLTCTNCISTVAKPTYSMQYTVTGRNENNCTDTATVLVRTFTGTPINIPNAFTPNGDGLNDIFYVMAGNQANLIGDFSIFNRWGEKIFNRQNVRPNDPEFGWNGTYKGQAASAGAYVYAVTMLFSNGNKQHYKGTVVLIR